MSSHQIFIAYKYVILYHFLHFTCEFHHRSVPSGIASHSGFTRLHPLFMMSALPRSLSVQVWGEEQWEGGNQEIVNTILYPRLFPASRWWSWPGSAAADEACLLPISPPTEGCWLLCWCFTPPLGVSCDKNPFPAPLWQHTATHPFITHQNMGWQTSMPTITPICTC